MTATSVQSLNPLTLPLCDRRLIEASAGTGKTYTISGLYLRLLLGHGGINPLTCEQILVVTFTNAATEELRDRIRRRIKLCYQRFLGLPVDDPFINQLFDDCDPEQRHIALRRLDLALKSLDEAAIFTIHGFCQRILADMAFESALLFESEFTLDDSQYLAQSVRDFWRYTCYQLPEALAAAIAAKFSTPDDLGRQLRPLLGASQAKASKQPQNFSKLQEQLTTQISRLKLAWPREREQVEKLLHSLPLNGTSYGKQADGYPKLARMLDEMDNWVKFYSGLPDPKLMTSLSLSGLKLKKGGVIPTAEEAPVLAQIESLAEAINNMLPAFLYEARALVDSRFHELKAERNLMSPDDLLLTLARAIGFSSGVDADAMEQVAAQLKVSIAKRFPVALIDEFQDTDPLQYAIFSGIYPACEPAADTDTDTNTPKPGTDIQVQGQAQGQGQSNTLLMIGDPKQAIYAFRGADIFTYIGARKETDHHYNLGTNYRSAHAMVDAVNSVFSLSDDPFISEAIPFESVAAADQGNKLLREPNSDGRALKIRMLAEHSEKGLNKTNARKWLAADAAEEISRLLNAAQEGQCLVANNDKPEKDRPLKAKDIAVLVRDRNEAAVMQNALQTRHIGAVFLSRDSVLHTDEAREMLLILRALATPRDERAIRSALACRLLGFDGRRIHEFNQSETLRSEVLDQFMQLHEHWARRGIMPALLMLADKYQLLERLATQANAERRLTDFRHLAELLQQQSAELDGQSALVNWFEQAMAQSANGEEQQLRLASEQNLVQIVTIHKSKGLEYPVCFIPFVSLARDNSRRPSPMLYHKGEELIWDLDATYEAWEAAKQETLAEDLRLLYVALTRPVYRCYLSVANHCRMNKSGINSFLKDTAIGYLLGITDKSCDAQAMEQAVLRLTGSDSVHGISSEWIADEISQTSLTQTDTDSEQQFAPLTPASRLGTPWRVGSYSGLVRHLPHEHTAPGAGDEDLSDEVVVEEEQAEPEASRFTFERGANAGSFMHLVLEEIDFTNAEADLPLQLPTCMAKYGIDEVWQPVLNDWYLDLLHSPLQLTAEQSLTLSQLSSEQKLVEMEFYLPLGTQDKDSEIQDIALSRLLSRFGYGGELKFDAFCGMLKGFIDLTFEHQGRFYIADYKSNHLGDDFDAYSQVNMSRAISSHRYDLQYILYTLALHRYLELKLPDYSYQKHIGGCFYLFLRGMSAAHPGAGVYFDKPDEALILALDKLLKGETQTQQDDQLEFDL
ncbi:exodeoxyribonuclease V subunit beta [Shewanella submarina]|uniref:RecBCD enzyme subunit RecB n=1 Tax=Shewanella submarina TaxID=2016376 RepID=A0ABV7GD40_9GAMM|nr:exodeoxyribonuclease V subunit beta [Shewanella submarina]MCL1039175.1 exodeoxyribonuclease V subunit beta [Shewanella submarina]